MACFGLFTASSSRPSPRAAHFRDKFEARRAPSFNFNQEQSLQSMDKIAALLKAERAQLWINHDGAQSATIPHAPQYVQ